mmetsp:Transcript_101975/g.288765  ORF Transcript_101975/g.288765 Transcript_101975/m.288765 type:complete len:322 (+) Transcript_101975:114-1079(+)
MVWREIICARALERDRLRPPEEGVLGGRPGRRADGGGAGCPPPGRPRCQAPAAAASSTPAPAAAMSALCGDAPLSGSRSSAWIEPSLRANARSKNSPPLSSDFSRLLPSRWSISSDRCIPNNSSSNTVLAWWSWRSYTWRACLYCGKGSMPGRARSTWRYASRRDRLQRSRKASTSAGDRLMPTSQCTSTALGGSGEPRASSMARSSVVKWSARWVSISTRSPCRSMSCMWRTDRPGRDCPATLWAFASVLALRLDATQTMCATSNPSRALSAIAAAEFRALPRSSATPPGDRHTSDTYRAEGCRASDLELPVIGKAASSK